MRHLAILMPVLMAGLSVATAQPLSVAVEEGLASNPALAADTARLEAAREAIVQARAQGLPNVEIMGSSTYSEGSFDPGDEAEAAIASVFSSPMGDGGMDEMGPDLADSFGPGDGRVSNQAQIAVTQPIFTGFQILNGIREAQASVEAASARLDRARQGYAYQIADAYLRVVSAEAEIRAVEKSVQSLTQAHRATEVSFEAGQSTRTDVALAQSRLAAVRAQLAGAQADAIAARQAFSVVGGDGIQNFVLPETGAAVPASVDEAMSIAVRQHPELAAAALDRDAAKAAVKGAKGSRAPKVQLRGAYSYAEGQFFEGDRSSNASIAAEVQVPLFEGGAISSRIRQARAEDRAARFAETDTLRRVTADIQTAMAGYQASLRAAEAASARLEAAELAWRGVQLEREVGQRSVLDVLRVEEDLLAAQVGDVNAKAQVIRASWQVAFATGTLAAESGSLFSV